MQPETEQISEPPAFKHYLKKRGKGYAAGSGSP